MLLATQPAHPAAADPVAAVERGFAAAAARHPQVAAGTERAAA